MEMLKLPGGYLDEKGIVHREVEMNPLTGKEEELVAQNHKQESASLVTMVLSRCLRRLGSIAPVPVNVIGRLPVEDRQFLLLKLREITFGDRVQATVTCPGPGCGNKVDINFSTKDITDREHVDKEPQIELELEANCPGCGREFTIPFDIPNFFSRELRTSIDLLYREVHFLAYHYHWSEREILEMSREKRHKYIEILLEEIEKITDERILPPVGFRYGNVNNSFMLESQTHEPVSRCLHPLKEDNKTEVKGIQSPPDDGHDMNHHRMKTQQKDPIRIETPPDSEVQDTEIEENPAEEIRKRENIEIPGYSEKGIAFPSLHRENPQSQKPELGGVPPSVGVNLVFTQKKDKIELPDGLPLRNKVTEIETQFPEEIGEIKDGDTDELEKFENPRQEHLIMNTKEPGNKFQIPNSKFQTNSKSQIPNFKQKPNSGSQTKPRSQMLNKSQTLDRENRQSQKPELVGIPPSVGVNLASTPKKDNLVFTQEKDKIEFSDSLQVKDKVTEIDTKLPGKMEKAAEQESIHITGSKKLQEPAAVKKGVNEKSKKSEAIKEKSIEIQLPEKIGEIVDGKTVELEKFESPRQEHPIMNTKDPGNKLQIPNTKFQTNSKSQIPNFKQKPNSGSQTNSKSQMLNKSQTLDRENRQSQKPESVKDKVVETQLSGKPETVKEKSNEIQLPEEMGGKAGEPDRMGKSASYDKRTGESKVKVISKDEIVSRSSPEAARRIEQLREQVRRLNRSKTLNPEISYSLSGAEVNREIEQEEPVQIPNPPDQPITIVKSLPTRTNTSQTTSAFWERSYLARFHLRTLR